MPSVIPSSGHVYVLAAAEMQTPSVADYFGPPGSQQKWNNEGRPEWAYRCELTNYSSQVALNVELPLYFNQNMPEKVAGQEHSWKQGPLTSKIRAQVEISRLDPGPDGRYVFYIWNCCLYRFITVSAPDNVEASGRDEDRKVFRLKQSTSNFRQPLTPNEPESGVGSASQETPRSSIKQRSLLLANKIQMFYNEQAETGRSLSFISAPRDKADADANERTEKEFHDRVVNAFRSQFETELLQIFDDMNNLGLDVTDLGQHINAHDYWRISEIPKDLRNLASQIDDQNRLIR